VEGAPSHKKANQRTRFCALACAKAKGGGLPMN
jgi:hypothetical protein